MKITKVDNKIKATFNQSITNTSIQNQNDKYLFDRNRTIGFRKDKKLYKFVGLRDGYSKQLEFSVKSVIINGNEKIASNRVNFSELNLSGETLIHEINNLSFHNRIDLTTYKNLIKINEPFKEAEIIYEIHLNGIKIKDNSYLLNGKKIYRQNEKGQFLILDDGNNEILFRIDNPIAYNENGKIYNIVSHQLYKKEGKIYYQKTANISEKIDISYPLYIDANIIFNLNEYSNIRSYNYDQNNILSWTNARNGLNEVTLNTNNDTLIEFQQYDAELITAWNSNSFWITFSASNPNSIYASTNNPLAWAITDLSSAEPNRTYRISLDYSQYSSAIVLFSVWEYNNGTTQSITSYTITSGYQSWNHTTTPNTNQIAVRFSSNTSSNVTFGANIYLHLINIPNGVDYYYDTYIERQVLLFDTTNIFRNSINNMELKFNITNPENGEYSIQKTNTLDDNVVSINDFDSYIGNYYNRFSTTSSIGVVNYNIDLGQEIIDDFNDFQTTKLMIRDYEYDYLNQIPPYLQTTLNHNWSYGLEMDLNITYITGRTILNFNLFNNGFGVIYSQGSTYNDTYSGLTYTIVIHNSTSGTYSLSTSYKYDLVNHNMYRTFLSFDTRILSLYDKYIIKNVKLTLKNYNSSDDISIFGGTQDILSGLTNTEFNSYGDFYLDVEGVTPNTLTNVYFNKNIITPSEITKFVLRNKDYDYGGNPFPTEIIESEFGIDFSETTLTIELEPYLISGLEYIKNRRGDIINLYANKNTIEGDIYWSNDENFNNILGSGNTLQLNTTFYNSGDIIYAAILDISGNTISTNILNVFLDLFDLAFNSLPERNFNVHDVDIDAVYFKYHKCLSGVTYTYARELGDVYEQNIQVSDGEGLGSYNMYSEFDIIDEFFSNSHDVEVVARMEDIDLTISYKRINDVYIHEGTRVLLYSTPPSNKDGIYIANYNLKLIKSGELDDADKSFRYKAHVGAGTYLDYEFHTIYYTTSGSTEVDDNDFDYLDGNIYGETIIDFDVYSDILFDANLFT